MSSANATRMEIDKATSGEFCDDEELQNEFRNLGGRSARGLAEKQTAEGEASRLQLEQEEKQSATMMAESSFVNVAKHTSKSDVSSWRSIAVCSRQSGRRSQAGVGVNWEHHGQS